MRTLFWREILNNSSNNNAKTMNKCEDAGFQHAWENTTSNLVYTTNPPQYPPTQYTCKNCGLVRTHRSKTENWVEYSDGQPHNDVCFNGESITIGSGDLTSNAGTTTISKFTGA